MITGRPKPALTLSADEQAQLRSFDCPYRKLDLSEKRGSKTAAESVFPGCQFRNGFACCKTATCQLLGVADRARVDRQHVCFSTILRRGRVSGGPAFVPVMQPTNLGHRHDSPYVLRLDRSRLGRVLA